MLDHHVRDDLVPAGPWKFDAAVTECFGDMLARSIPDLAGLHRVLLELVDELVPPAPVVVDLGCSRGDLLAKVRDVRPGGCYVGVDVSEPMVAAARRTVPDAQIQRLDLVDAYPTLPRPANLALAVFTLQFLPPAARSGLLRRIRERIVPGGVLLVAEKVRAADTALDGVLVDTYHRRKLANGYTAAQVEAKRRALAGVLVPWSAAENERALREAGFTVEPVWRCLNFAAWLAVPLYPYPVGVA